MCQLYSQVAEPFNAGLKVPPVHCPQQNVYGIVQLFPHVRRWQVDALLHVARGLETGLAELGHLGKDSERCVVIKRLLAISLRKN
jgi:hypothetical protein